MVLIKRLGIFLIAGNRRYLLLFGSAAPIMRAMRLGAYLGIEWHVQPTIFLVL